MGSTYDFGGWATKNNLKCSDGRTILKGAFDGNDGMRVPLIWNHKHDDPDAVLGHADLEVRDEGVYCNCSFNDTEKGQKSKKIVQHGDIGWLSIWANQLVQNANDVLHGNIREVSLVLAGANPGAKIENVILAHSDEYLDDEAIICPGTDLDIFHSEEKSDEKEDSSKKKENDEDDENDEEKIADVISTMDDKQKNVLAGLVVQALEEGAKSKSETEDSEEGEKDMKHNAFTDDQQEQNTLVHDGLNAILNDAKRLGSLKESYLAHAAEYGIENIDWLFPDAKKLQNQPEFIKRTPDAWVDVVMGGVHKTPFSRIRMMFADLREDDARAKGYAQKGKLKKEEVFGLLRRAIDPTTIYKKQKLDRDDIIDITDFEIVSWLKAEMRMMLDEEIARAILFGDGRSASSEDKIRETNIIPIVKEESLFAIHKEVKPASGESFSHAFITAAVKGQDDYEGSGNTILFTANTYITDMLLMEDADGHRMYKDMNELALAMSVNRIVKVPASIIPSGIYGVIVDLKDYNVGADKGGAINMFDDFDIDYNQYKYLIETRCSGALTKPFSAIVLEAESRG